MGASSFTTILHGKSAKRAFDSVEHGHAYAGNITAKHDFVELAVPKGTRQSTVLAFAKAVARNYGYLIQETNDTWADEKHRKACAKELKQLERKFAKLPFHRAGKIADDKWGPAVAMRLLHNSYVFFGMASE